MTTAQIAILSTLFILDISLFIDHVKKSGDPFLIPPHFFRILLVWSALVVVIFELNKYHRGYKCPELEKVENVYKIK